jgi:hypothetical protein
MTMHYGLLLVVLLATPHAAASAQPVTFASEQATVPLPASYSVTLSGDGLTAVFGAEGDHKLELTLLGKLSNKDEQDLGAQFIADQAEKKGKKIFRSKRRAVLMDVAGDHKSGERTYRVVHWQVGAGNCVFTMTLTAPVPMSQDLDDFLIGPLNEILNNVACKAL